MCIILLILALLGGLAMLGLLLVVLLDPGPGRQMMVMKSKYGRHVTETRSSDIDDL